VLCARSCAALLRNGSARERGSRSLIRDVRAQIVIAIHYSARAIDPTRKSSAGF
jgi:hypothetical protein